MRSAGVLVAAAGLVAAVWLSLVLSQTTGDDVEGEGARVDIPETFGTLADFLADSWDDGTLAFVEIEAGPFLMGSDPSVDPTAFDIERWSADAVQGLVDLPTFYAARYEVTVAQYAAFLATTGHPLAEPAALAAPPDHPVTHVAWTDAVAFARWLDQQLREDPSTPEAIAALLTEGWTVTLPTEAQWEKAARGDDGRVYPWGDQPNPNRANFAGRATSPVGTFGCPECPYELYDMAGNAWEWTRSPYQPYPYDESDDREGLDQDALWVMRGGSFADPAHFVRAANRGGADPGARRPFLGFRVVISPP